jgi:hypothetical protein
LAKNSPTTLGDRAVFTKLCKVGRPKIDLSTASDKHLAELLESYAQSNIVDVRKAFGATLKVVGKDDTGGTYAEWTVNRHDCPVVYFSTEGYFGVAGASLPEFLGLLAYCEGEGWGTHDIVLHWSQVLTTLDGKSSKSLEPPLASVNPEMASVLADAGIPIPPDPSATIEAANRKYLWPLFDQVDLHATGFKAYRIWFDAWRDASLPEPRHFSPDQSYGVGERVTYTYKSSDGSGVGKAVVLANPRAQRVLLTDEHSTFLRVCV